MGVFGGENADTVDVAAKNDPAAIKGGRQIVH
jgi:hypothetical protein